MFQLTVWFLPVGVIEQALDGWKVFTNRIESDHDARLISNPFPVNLPDEPTVIDNWLE